MASYFAYSQSPSRGCPAASHFFCFAKKSNQKKATRSSRPAKARGSQNFASSPGGCATRGSWQKVVQKVASIARHSNNARRHPPAMPQNFGARNGNSKARLSACFSAISSQISLSFRRSPDPVVLALATRIRKLVYQRASQQYPVKFHCHSGVRRNPAAFVAHRAAIPLRPLSMSSRAQPRDLLFLGKLLCLFPVTEPGLPGGKSLSLLRQRK